MTMHFESLCLCANIYCDGLQTPQKREKMHVLKEIFHNKIKTHVKLVITLLVN